MRDSEAFTPEFQQYLDDEVGQSAVSFRLLYRWMTEDTSAALMLSQIIYWHRPSEKTGLSKVQVAHDGKRWLVKKRTDWRLEIGMSPREADTALNRLAKLGLIEKEVHFFQGTLQTYIHIKQAEFIQASRTALAVMLKELQAEDTNSLKSKSQIRKLQDSNLQNGELVINETVNCPPTNLQIRENNTEITLTKTTKPKTTKKSVAADAAPPPNPEPVETEAPQSNPTPSRPATNGKERPTPAKTEPLAAGGPKRTPAELARANAIVDRLEVRCKTSRKIASSGLYDVAWKILGINPDEDGTGIDTAYGDPPPDIPRTQWNWWLHDYRGRGDPEKNRPPDYPKHYQVLETYLVSREPVRVSLKMVANHKSRGTPGANGDPNIDGIAQARARYEARESKHNGPMIEGRVIHG